MHLFGVIFLCPLPSLMFVLFIVDSMIQGNYEYKDIWDSHLGEELACRHERNNIHDTFAIGVLNQTLLSATYQEQYRLPVMYSLDEQDLQFAKPEYVKVTIIFLCKFLFFASTSEFAKFVKLKNLQ